MLDLFKTHSLRFETIAEVAVAATYTKPLTTVAPRYDQSPTLSAAEWDELVDAVGAANASTPTTDEEGTTAPPALVGKSNAFLAAVM